MTKFKWWLIKKLIGDTPVLANILSTEDIPIKHLVWTKEPKFWNVNVSKLVYGAPKELNISVSGHYSD